MMTNLRAAVKAWYSEEAARVAAAFEECGDLGKIDFGELVRRSQALFACEMVDLIQEEQGVRLSPGSNDYLQLQRVAQAIRAHGAEVPDSIKQVLGED